jgi:hypothetical protein
MPVIVFNSRQGTEALMGRFLLGFFFFLYVYYFLLETKVLYIYTLHVTILDKHSNVYLLKLYRETLGPSKIKGIKNKDNRSPNDIW